MAITPQRERMAEAFAVERIHGVGAAAFVASRIGDLRAAGDSLGVERWDTIGAALSALKSGAGKAGQC